MDSVRVLCTFLLLGLLATSARADKILLKNGGVFEGVIIKDDGKNVTLRTEHGTITFRHKQIVEIRKGPWSPASAKAKDGAKDGAKDSARRPGTAPKKKPTVRRTSAKRSSRRKASSSSRAKPRKPT
ncbi:MAG: hypothetical protein CMJ83_08320 [Planctomycetes bacterium]|jgi:hypothetical protein|nr:hypothetical protein [Planctomycetota bacterium]